jgi:glycosyltransferase involved in cell wall biosynthesis
VKLIIQIPCWNESESIADVVQSLPTEVPGVDVIETIVVDDGSVDGTAREAQRAGVTEVIRLPRHLGLAGAFSAGVEAALRRDADILVNTDADLQYPSDHIPTLIGPLLEGRADMVIGNRLTQKPPPFGPFKMMLQRLGSSIVRVASGTNVADAASGFRALSRSAMEALFIHGKFSYTLESVLLAGVQELGIANIPITTNPTVRQSRLVRSLPSYISRSAITILRSYLMYHPLRLFMGIGMLLLMLAAGIGGRFIYFYVTEGGGGHVQSLILLAVLAIAGFQAIALGMVAEVVAANRRLLEEQRLYHLRESLERNKNSKTMNLRLYG